MSSISMIYIRHFNPAYNFVQFILFLRNSILISDRILIVHVFYFFACIFKPLNNRINLLLPFFGRSNQKFNFKLGLDCQKYFFQVWCIASFIVKWNEIFIEYNSVGFHLFKFLAEEFLINKPSVAVVVQDFLSDKLFIFFEICNQMLQIFPSKGDVSCLCILFD